MSCKRHVSAMSRSSVVSVVIVSMYRRAVSRAETELTIPH
jgi:hypothetical protein